MQITKVFNNNVVLAKDKNNTEVVVMGCGLAFQKKVKDIIDEDKIEKTFILKEKDAREKFKLLLEDVPCEHVSLTYDIIEYAKNMLNVPLNDYIYITLTDHISYTIKLCEEGIKRPNILLWEIKKFYPKEFKVGLKSIEFIKSEIDVDLPDDEAANIALHLINAQINDNSSHVNDAVSMTKKIEDIFDIVRYSFNIKLDEDSLNYERFVTHLRFFFKRIENNELKLESDDFLLPQVKKKYPKAYECMLKIEKYLGTDLSDEEKLYLTLHIERVTSRR